MHYHLNHTLGMLAAVQVGVTTEFSSVKTKSAYKDLERRSPEAACYV